MIYKMRLVSLKRVFKLMRTPLIIGIFISIIFLGNAITLLKGASNILDLSEKEMNNAYVYINVNSIFDSFWTDRSVSGKVATFHGISTDNNEVILAIRTSSRQHLKLGAIQFQTENYLKEGKLDNTEKIVIVGLLTRMTDAEENAFHESLIEKGIDLENRRIHNYILLPGDNPFGNNKSGVYLWGGVGAALLLMVVFQIIYGVFGGYQRKIKKSLRLLSDDKRAEIDKEYEGSESFSGDIRIGNTYTFCHKGARTEVFVAADVKGIYVQKAKIQRKKGETKFDLIIKLKDGINIKVLGKETGRIITYYKEHYPMLKNLIVYEQDTEK